MSKIRINHPDLKGFFHCLGMPFNVLSEDSMKKCEEMLTWSSVTAGDKKQARRDIQEAKDNLKNWERKSYMEWFYTEVEEQEGTDIYTTN